MKQITATGQTVNEAVKSALKELNATREKVEIRVIEEGKKGFFGLFGSKQAVVEVKVNTDPIIEAETFLKNVAEKMGVHVEINKVQREKEVIFQLSGEKIAILIGKRGQTLNSLQFLTQLVANRFADHYLTVIVDAEDYRKRRRETLESLAHRLAAKAEKDKKPVNLEPMPSYERKIIHNVLYKNKKVKTLSEGEEPRRYIVIKPNKNK